MSKARLVITAVVIEGRTHAEVAKTYGASRGWVSRLIPDAGPDTIAWHLTHHHRVVVSLALRQDPETSKEEQMWSASGDVGVDVIVASDAGGLVREQACGFTDEGDCGIKRRTGTATAREVAKCHAPHAEAGDV